MLANAIKKVLAATWYREGGEHHILFGPMRGMKFKCGENTGFAALHSGNERANQKVYASVVRPGDTVVDAGANWGVHSLYLARLVGPAGRVLAFEPHPLVVEELRWHVSRNRLNQVSVHACGLSDSEGLLPFILDENSKTSHIAATGESTSGDRRVDVPFHTLDSVFEEQSINEVRLIKIDVEGAEGRALRGAENTIRRHRPHLVVELHSPEQDLDVARLLTSWGYELKRVEGPELRYLDRPWPEKHGVWGTLHAVPR